MQFEDFANRHAFELLAKYSKTHLVFNDGIQRATFMVLSRLIASLKLVGSEASASLVSHPHVDKIAFTRNTAIGSKIMTAAAQLMKPVSLELGGKSLILVFEGVDLNMATEWIAFDCFWTISRRTQLASTRKNGSYMLHNSSQSLIHTISPHFHHIPFMPIFQYPLYPFLSLSSATHPTNHNSYLPYPPVFIFHNH